MTIKFDGVGSHWPTSERIRAEVAAGDEPIILSFSRGKDSIAAWLALRDAGVRNIVPVYYYRVPGLQFTTESLDYFEQTFETKIHRLPHPSLYRMWQNGVFQPITRTGLMIATRIPEVTYQDLEAAFREDQQLSPYTRIATGVRAADSIARRTFLKKSGPYTASKKRLAVIWDWTIKETYDRIEAAGIKLPPDYEWFARVNPRTGRRVKNSGRTFDGLAYQFLEPLSRHAPDDYARILEWFPLAELELIRHDLETS